VTAELRYEHALAIGPPVKRDFERSAGLCSTIRAQDKFWRPEILSPSDGRGQERLDFSIVIDAAFLDHGDETAPPLLLYSVGSCKSSHQTR